MNKKYFLMALGLLLGILFFSLIEGNQRENIYPPDAEQTSEIINVSEFPTVAATLPQATNTVFAPPTITPLAVYPTLDKTSVRGKILYWHIEQHALEIMDANGDNKLAIPYNPKEGLVPIFAIPVQWSPNGQSVAFGCLDAEDPEVSGVCILNLVEYIKHNKGGKMSESLKMIQLPPGYIANRFETQINSLEWTYDGLQIVLAPFCLVDIAERYSTCSTRLENISSTDRLILENAQYIAPSPANPDLWAVATEGVLYLGSPVTGDFQPIDTEKSNSFIAISWSHDGEQIAFLSEANITNSKYIPSLGIINKSGVNLNKMLSVVDLKDRIDPNFVITQQSPIILGNFTHINKYPPRQNLSWSPDNHYIALNVFYYFLRMDPVLLDAAGIFYFDIFSEDLLPAQVDFKDFQLYASPDWYACDDIENVCELYK